MTDPARRRVLTELYASQGWPAQGDELLSRSLGPRAPELLLEAPGWLGLNVGQLVLEAGCRDATHAIALARRYGCRVLGIDLVGAWLPKGRADAWELAPGDRRLLVEGLQNSPVSMHQPSVEAAIATAGLQVIRRERIAWAAHTIWVLNT